ncbi:MAG: copper chaperone PCu(A)C [Alphaproteobacteria bacterium]|nr:copper chaperone PCu(A)C [Alphaproteobacteria bacterium]
MRAALAILVLAMALPAWAGPGDKVVAGDLTIEHPWSRATAGKVGAVYLELHHRGAGDRLLGGESPRAGKVELHNTVRDGDIMRMRPVETIAVPARGKVELKPGGLHIMLMDLKGPLNAGESVPLTLRFEKAGAVALEASIERPGAAGHQHKH